MMKPGNIIHNRTIDITTYEGDVDSVIVAGYGLQTSQEHLLGLARGWAVDQGVDGKR